nr:tumor necrosis factor receptor superfamily member 14 isoform X2 [Columba livia]
MGRPRGRRPRGRPLGRDPARRTMPLVLAAVLVTQLGGAEALDCGLGEYPAGTECCPMCAAGANLVPEVACTHTRNTGCGCPAGFFCSSVGTQDCELCQRYTICFPGSMLKEKGTKTTDNVCEACPPGTFSTADMPYACTPWPKHNEGGPGQGEGGNPSSDYAVATIASVVAIVLLVAAGFACVWQRRKRKGFVPPVQEPGSGQQGQTLMGNKDNGDQTAVPVQERGAGLEEIRLE